MDGCAGCPATRPDGFGVNTQQRPHPGEGPEAGILCERVMRRAETKYQLTEKLLVWVATAEYGILLDSTSVEWVVDEAFQKKEVMDNAPDGSRKGVPFHEGDSSGYPQVLVTDNRTQFSAGKIEDLCLELDIQHRTTSMSCLRPTSRQK
ncbi:hypothetical protein LIER_38177 [Lithospermum erythrorhizon]|uniref:Integrase catalytic domain-containing protein n=1 Tax=Lithospermum erythrorhizon TaxID=34254 RepID=A0AAV3Q0B1_LITER